MNCIGLRVLLRRKKFRMLAEILQKSYIFFEFKVGIPINEMFQLW